VGRIGIRLPTSQGGVCCTELAVGALFFRFGSSINLFGPKRDEVTGEWRKLHNEELNDLYSSPSIVRVIKPRRMRWVGHVARMARGEAYTGFWW
jgi:hypothetical protein